jgi:hypothetical protein
MLIKSHACLPAISGKNVPRIPKLYSPDCVTTTLPYIYIYIYVCQSIKCIYRNTKVIIKFNDGISESIHINKGARQRCDLSPVLFNIYINKIIQELKTVIKKVKQLTNRKLVNLKNLVPRSAMKRVQCPKLGGGR